MEINIAFIQLHPLTEESDLHSKKEFNVELTRKIEKVYNDGRQVVTAEVLNARLGLEIKIFKFKPDLWSHASFEGAQEKNSNGNYSNSY